MKAAEFVIGQPWAITPEALGVILAIAERRNESPEAVEARLGRPLDNTHETTIRDGVAIIPVVGPISRHADLFSQISGATSIETLARDFRTALDDRSVKAVILDMDTPGGTVSGVSEFAQHVAEARGKGKPIVAYVGSQAASAGYWIAAAADAVVVDPTATVGSIGVVMGMRKPADAKAGQARTIEFVSSQSPHKRPDPETETGRAQIQAVADDLADVFVDSVAANRGVPRETVLSDFGRGGVLVGAKAVEAGMADRVGSLEPLIAELARGECPARKTPRTARKGKTPKEPAMSEPTTPPIAGDPNVITMSAADHAAFMKRIADSEAAARSESQAKAEMLTRSIDTEAKAFATEVITGQCKATAFERPTIVDAMSLALRDDHEHPIPGKPTARQDSVRAIYEKRSPHTLTEEVGAADPKRAGRALASDPYTDAQDDPQAAEKARLARERREREKAENQAYAKAHNGVPSTN